MDNSHLTIDSLAIKERIRQAVIRAVGALGGEEANVSLDRPVDPSHGDYTTNVAFSVAKLLKKSPLQVAEEIAQNLLSRMAEFTFLENIEAVKPGFINFRLSDAFLQAQVQEIVKDPNQVGKTKKIGNGRKVVVEYSSPNIAKPFTIGHLRSTIIGDAIANLLEAVGYEVYRDNHVGDWGTQFGKQIYAIKEWGNEEVIEKSENPVKELVALYIKFHEEAELHPEIENKAREWFKKLEDGDSEARRLWQKCIDWSWKEFEAIYDELGVHFTENAGRGYGESFFEERMAAVIQELKDKHLLKEDNKAQLVYFPEDKLPPLMVVKSDGATLYATRDLTTDKFRLEHYGSDVLVINEVGSEQSLYWRQIFETESMAGWYKPGQRIHVSHGLFRFKEGKMSTRKGNTIWLEDVLREAQERAWNLQKHESEIEGQEVLTKSLKHGDAAKGHALGYAERINLAKPVAVGALKWNDLKRNSHMDIAFDWDEVLSMQGNSGPYVQYSYVRTQSILEKAEKAGIKANYPSDYTPTAQEKDLLRMLAHYPEVVQDTAEHLSPSSICTYLYDLAKGFNGFYQSARIVDAPTKNEQQFRVGLTQAIGIIVQSGLRLLGIEAPKRM